MKPNAKYFTLESIAENAILDYGFTPFQGRAALASISKLKAPIFNKKEGILDLRHLPWSSMDNIDSQDLDQCEMVESHPRGNFLVRIAIADVDHFVKRGDPVDRHASHNATSLYTGIKNYPMLPEQLSYDLSSLLQDEDRLCIIVEYKVKKDGSVISGDVYRAWIRNKAKLVYEQVSEWLLKKSSDLPQGLEHAEIQQQVLWQWDIAKRLRSFRQDEGMLEFETTESKPLIEGGKIVSIRLEESTPAHKIIEQFMIAANQTMVAFLTKHDQPTIQRIVRVPERWGKIVEIADMFGFHLPPEPDPIVLRQFLVRERKKNPDGFADLSLTIIKLIGRGEYEMVNPGKLGHGHFGLAIGNYTHSTAPNRRYIDIIIQRLVKAVLDKAPIPYTKRELVELAAWCTERDTASKKVERFMRKVAAAILLMKHVGEEFTGIVTGASSKGVYVRLFEPPAEGRIMRNERGLDVGQKVVVRLVAVDPVRGHIDFTRVSILK